MRVLLAAVAWPLMGASFCVTVVHEPLRSSALTLGTGEEFGVSQIAITQASGPVTRAEIIERLPFAALYEWEAADILEKKSASSKWGTLAAYWGVVKDAGPSGMAFAAARTHDERIRAGLLITAGVWALAGGRIKAKVPDPTQTKLHLLPDIGVPGNWNGVILTGLNDILKFGPACSTPVNNATTADWEYDHTPTWYLARIMASRLNDLQTGEH